MESPSTSPDAFIWGVWFPSGIPLLQTPGTKFRVHWEGDHACSLMLTAWPTMESSSVCFLLHFHHCACLQTILRPAPVASTSQYKDPHHTSSDFKLLDTLISPEVHAPPLCPSLFHIWDGLSYISSCEVVLGNVSACLSAGI